MSRGIIQTAVTNKDLGLELTYYPLSAFPEIHASTKQPVNGTGMVRQYGDLQVWDEFVC